MTKPIPEIIQLLKAGKRQSARAELVALIREQPGDERGWFLLSMVVDDPAQQRDALQRVLQINPDNADAQQRLRELESEAAPTPQAAPGGRSEEPTESAPVVESTESQVDEAEPDRRAASDFGAAEPVEEPEPAAIPWLKTDTSAEAVVEEPSQAAAAESGFASAESSESDVPARESWDALRDLGPAPWELDEDADDEFDETDGSWEQVPQSRLDSITGAFDRAAEDVPLSPTLPGSGFSAPLAESESKEETGDADDEAFDDEDDPSISQLRKRARKRPAPASRTRGERIRSALRLVILSLITFALLGGALGFAGIQLGRIPPPTALAGILPLNAPSDELLGADATQFVEIPQPSPTATEVVLRFPTLPPAWTPTAESASTEPPPPTATLLPTPTTEPGEEFPDGLPGGQIAFVRHSGGEDFATGLTNIFVMQAPQDSSFVPATEAQNSANPEIPITFASEGQNLAPAGSPDAQRLAWAASVDGAPDILSVPLPAALVDPQIERTNLTNDAAIDTDPAWSPDGSRLAFASDRADGSFHIFVLNVETGELTQLTSGQSNNLEPHWSPDGSEIVFASDRSGDWDIFVVAADGENIDQLTLDPADDRQPVYSPQGDQIAFVSERDGNPDIYVMGTDGSAPINVTFEPDVDTEPAWSPDGAWIVFSSNRDGNFELYMLSLAEIRFHRLTDTPGLDERMPDWLPFAQPFN